jgi:mitotic spindle assembly checkpoint protein MAD2B
MATHEYLIHAFSSLLTAAIHTILHERGLYPPETFIATRFHNYPVYQNRHPLVCQWITDAVSAVQEQMFKGSVKRVVVLIFGPEAWGELEDDDDDDEDKISSNGKEAGEEEEDEREQAGEDGEADTDSSSSETEEPSSSLEKERAMSGTSILERFIFDVSLLPVVPKNQRFAPLERLPSSPPPKRKKGEPRVPKPPPVYVTNQTHRPQRTTTTASLQHENIKSVDKLHQRLEKEISASFRALLARLQVLNDRLEPLPKGCTYSVAVELKDDAPVPGRYDSPWGPAEPSIQRERNWPVDSSTESNNDGNGVEEGDVTMDVGFGGEADTRATAAKPPPDAGSVDEAVKEKSMVAKPVDIEDIGRLKQKDLSKDTDAADSFPTGPSSTPPSSFYNHLAKHSSPDGWTYGVDLGGIRTTAIKSISAGELCFEVWVEEGRAKERLMRRRRERWRKRRKTKKRAAEEGQGAEGGDDEYSEGLYEVGLDLEDRMRREDRMKREREIDLGGDWR